MSRPSHRYSGPRFSRARPSPAKPTTARRTASLCRLTDEAAARDHLADNPALPDELKDALKGAADWDAFAAALDAAEATEAVKALKGTVAKVREKGLASYIFNSLIWPRAPKYLYFDEYYQMKGQANLNALIAREDAKTA